jgi:putative ABC transport system substrate-binding protein
MKRREFVTLVGGAVTWSLAVRAQQPAVPVIGYLYSGSQVSSLLVSAFQKGLGETDHFEGQNIAVEYRWANNALDQLPQLATDLVRRRVAVITTPGSYQAALAAKAATATIPIVFNTGVDPVQVGLVASLNRPGGNVTGVNYMQVELAAKQLGLLHELLPRATRFAVLVNPNNLPSREQQSGSCKKRLQVSASRETAGDGLVKYGARPKNPAEYHLEVPPMLIARRRAI